MKFNHGCPVEAIDSSPNGFLFASVGGTQVYKQFNIPLLFITYLFLKFNLNFSVIKNSNQSFKFL